MGPGEGVVLEIIRKLFEEYKFARRGALVWAICLITYAVVQFYKHLADIGQAQATVIIAIVGVLATVIGFYQWHRKGDE